MKAIDTNIVVRFLTGEDHPQTAIARKVIAEDTVYVPTTVLLETAWVLSSAYGFARKDIVDALRAFAGLPSVELEDQDRFIGALESVEHGMDLADALHVGAAAHCEAFITFDQKFIRAAAGMGYVVQAPSNAS